MQVLAKSGNPAKARQGLVDNLPQKQHLHFS